MVTRKPCGGPWKAVRRVLGFLGLAGLVSSPTPGVSAKVLAERLELESRVQAARESLERMADQVCNDPVDKIAQWPNWPNWRNWPNYWGNGPNWGNWFNR